MALKCPTPRTEPAVIPQAECGSRLGDVQDISDAHRFTPREKAVFALLLRDKNDAAIAKELQISEAAARAAYRKIARKLGVSARREVAQRTRQWNLAVARLLYRPDAVVVAAAVCHALAA